MDDILLSIGIVLVTFLILSLIQCLIAIFVPKLFTKFSDLSITFMIVRIVVSLILGFLWYVGGFIFYM